MFENLKVVLVEPRHPGNIGAAARAMKNMGFQNLVLVNPNRFPDPQADWRAAGAVDVLDRVACVETLGEAINNCQVIIGTSSRSRSIPWPHLDARELPARLSEYEESTRIAILFGREDSGLTNEELQCCHYHLEIPTDDRYPALNLAMAVQLVVYELFMFKEKPSAAGATWDRRLATSMENERMLEHFEAVLRTTGFLNENNPGKTIIRLKRMFLRMHLDETEVQILRGILNHFEP